MSDMYKIFLTVFLGTSAVSADTEDINSSHIDSMKLEPNNLSSKIDTLLDGEEKTQGSSDGAVVFNSEIKQFTSDSQNNPNSANTMSPTSRDASNAADSTPSSSGMKNMMKNFGEKTTEWMNTFKKWGNEQMHNLKQRLTKLKNRMTFDSKNTAPKATEKTGNFHPKYIDINNNMGS